MSAATPVQSTTPASPAVATRVGQSIADAYRAAILRARDEGLSAERQPDGTWKCKDYIVEFIGPRWHDVTCNCRGSNHIACKHRAIVIFGRKYGACRVAFKGKEVASPAASIAESTPEEVEQSEAVKRETLDELIAAGSPLAAWVKEMHTKYIRRSVMAGIEADAAYHDEIARRIQLDAHYEAQAANDAARAAHVLEADSTRIADDWDFYAA